MCIVCILIEKEKITKPEAMRALWEFIREPQLTAEDIQHIKELYGKLDQEGVKEDDNEKK
jgi:hypothetical protein